MARQNAPGQGRPRAYSTELPVYDTLEACAAATKVPLSALKIAKKGGCLAFRHGRVHFSEFVIWWFNDQQEPGEEDHIDWTKREKRATALIKEVKLEEERERVIDFSLVRTFLTHLISVGFFSEIDRLSNEFPASLKGKTEVEIREECDKQAKHIKKSLRDTVNNWVDKKGKI